MKKIYTKLLIIILVILCLNVCIDNIVCGYDWEGKVDEVAKSTDNSDASGKVRKLMGTIIVIVRVVCMGVAFIMLIALGIKYMVSAPGDRASVVKHAYVYLIGALLMFGSAGILDMIAKFAKGGN